MKERLEEIARALIKIALVKGVDEKAKARAAVLFLDTAASKIEHEVLGYDE